MTSQQERTTRRPQSALPETAAPREGADVGGIPATLGQGLKEAGDRREGRREGIPDAAGGASAAPMARESAAVSPRPARDKTGAPAHVSGSADSGGSGSPDAGRDDSVAESLGKAIAEPFKSS